MHCADRWIRGKQADHCTCFGLQGTSFWSHLATAGSAPDCCTNRSSCAPQRLGVHLHVQFCIPAYTWFHEISDGVRIPEAGFGERLDAQPEECGQARFCVWLPYMPQVNCWLLSPLETRALCRPNKTCCSSFKTLSVSMLMLHFCCCRHCTMADLCHVD